MTDEKTIKVMVDGEEVAIPQEKRTRCEVYSRVVGYIRPIKQWNDGKQAEFQDRQVFDKCTKC